MAKSAIARSPERAPDDEDDDAVAAADAEAEAREASLAERIRTGKAIERVPDTEPRKPNPEAAQSKDEPEELEEDVQMDSDEIEARRFGWRPEAEWKSTKPWKNVKDFLDTTFANRALFESRFEDYQKTQSKETAELSRKLDEALGVVGELFRDQKKIRAQEYARARAEIEGERQTAIAAGDVERVQALEAQRAEIDKLEEEAPVVEERPKPKPVEKPAEEVQQVPREVNDWVAENPWFTKDETLGDLARVEHRRLLREERGLTLVENLERVKQKVMDTYPDKFENPRRSAASQVGTPRSRANGAAAGGKKAHTFENLPADAQAQCLKWAKNGTMPREQYLKDYEWDLT